MEHYNNSSDITYKAELILDIFDVKDLIRTYNLLTLACLSDDNQAGGS